MNANENPSQKAFDSIGNEDKNSDTGNHISAGVTERSVKPAMKSKVSFRAEDAMELTESHDDATLNGIEHNEERSDSNILHDETREHPFLLAEESDYESDVDVVTSPQNTLENLTKHEYSLLDESSAFSVHNYDREVAQSTGSNASKLKHGFKNVKKPGNTSSVLNLEEIPRNFCDPTTCSGKLFI